MEEEKLQKVFNVPQTKAQILSTRPIEEQLIHKAIKQNISIDVLSFIETAPIDSIDIYEEIQTALLQSAIVVFTSMNAVEAVAAHLHDYKPDWTIYCIGNTTKKLVQEYFGDELIAGTAADANTLAQIIEDDITSEIIFFCGNKRRDELSSILNENNIDVNEIQVYQTNLIHHTIEKKYNGILFFSPSGVESFFLGNKLSEQTILFAIGNTTASALKKYSKNKIVIADEPGKNDLVEKAIQYFTHNAINK
jgi:uroporphyrinogen-III synthase